jgi:hypothetical protein
MVNKKQKRAARKAIKKALTSKGMSKSVRTAKGSAIAKRVK